MALPESPHRQILRLLKESRGSFCSGPYLASQMGISRTAIWKHIQKLRAKGYEISTHPKAGYRLSRVPDLLIPEEVLPDLKTTTFGRSYHHFMKTGSTNDLALRLATEGAPHGTVVVAEEQTEGRGRLGRKWLSSPRKGIYLSLIIRKPLPINVAHQTTLVTALALAKTLRNEYHLEAGIKWPNDVLIRGRKAAGILTEVQSDPETIRFLIVGIGINVNHDRKELVGPFRYPVTSLAIEKDQQIERRGVLALLLHYLENDFERLMNDGFTALLTELEEHSSILGKSIVVHSSGKQLCGKAVGFTSEGALKLFTKEGREEIVWVGDVTRVEGHL